MKSVAIKFYTELPWLIQYEFNLILTNTFSGYLMYGRDIQLIGIMLHD